MDKFEKESLIKNLITLDSKINQLISEENINTKIFSDEIIIEKSLKNIANLNNVKNYLNYASLEIECCNQTY